jgi:hypothetical protein
MQVEIMNPLSAPFYTDPSILTDTTDSRADNEDQYPITRGVEDSGVMEPGTTQDVTALAFFKTPDARNDKNDATFQDVSPNDIIAHANHRFAMTNIEDLKLPADQASEKKDVFTESPLSTTKISGPEDFDAIFRQTQIALNQKLENNKMWAQKLLAEVAVYSKTLAGVHVEYARMQEQEHQEAQRLDQVEPDVQGATSQMLDHSVATTSGYDSFQKMGGGYAEGGVKRRLDHD